MAGKRLDNESSSDHRYKRQKTESMDEANQHLHGHDDIDGGVSLYPKVKTEQSNGLRADPSVNKGLE